MKIQRIMPRVSPTAIGFTQLQPQTYVQAGFTNMPTLDSVTLREVIDKLNEIIDFLNTKEADGQ